MSILEVPTLETERFILRPLSVDDAEAVFEWAGDERVNTYMPYNTHRSPDDSRAWLATLSKLENEYQWGFVRKSDNKLIGTVRKGADIRAGLAQALENAGYSTEDTILCEFVFDSHAAGSYSANTDVTEALDLISHEYPFLYYSRTDVYLINN